MTRVTLNGADLHAAVAWAAGLCPARPSVPVLAGIRLDATDVGVRLSAFDWDTAGTVDASAWVTDPGSLLVSGRLLASVAKTVAKEADVTLTADPGAPVMTVSCGKAARWELPLIDLDDYPTLPTGGDPVGTVSADELGDALARVLPAVSGDVQPPSLRGVALSATADGPMILAATDRYRLAVAELDWTPSGGQAIDEVMVPTELFVAAMTAVSRLPTGTRSP